MANLVEDVLRNIFDYLAPLEWINVSQVSQLWKEVVSKQWRKITEITYLEREIEMKFHLKKAPFISATDSEKIIICAAPFVEVLSASAGVFRKETLIKLGPFSYMVRGFDPDSILKLLAQNATNITEVRFDVPPKAELLQLLINTNNIKKVAFRVCGAFYENVPTDKIEELNASFYDSDDIKSFQGHFPKLKKIDLSLDCRFSPDLRQTLSPILPYVLGVTSFHLHIMFVRRSISCKDFLDIAELSKLEELSLEFDQTNHTTDVDFFVNKLTTGCPKLHTVNFLGMMISEKDLHSLLTLPQLKNLDVGRVLDFDLIKLPKVINVSQLRIDSDYTNSNVTNFVKVLKNMPKLKILELNDKDLDSSLKSSGKNDLEDLVERQMVKLVCDLATAVVSQEKEIVVRKSYYNKHVNELKISRKNAGPSDMDIQTLNLGISFYNETTFFENIKTFVQNELQSHDAVIVECQHN